jgi:Protein of unknown function (DUF2442)
MSTSAKQVGRPFALNVEVNDDSLTVQLADGRALSVPLTWFPRLEHATQDERAGWTLIAGGTGIHWESVDEDIEVESLLAGRRSMESTSSLNRWLSRRLAGQ